MIYESYVYKEDLGRIYTRMYKRKTQKRWSDHSTFLVEKDFFIGFFLIRKLIEAKTKLTIGVSSQNIDLIKFSSSGKKATTRNRHEIDGLYNLDKGHMIQKKIDFVCNMAVHSFVFMPIVSEKGLRGFFFNSAHERETALYQISIDEVIRIFKSVGNCYISSMVMRINQDGEYEIISAS